MDKRTYNKIFVNKNRDEGSEKLALGYKYNAHEIVLKKDQETYFHVPYFISPVLLGAGSLIEDGATGGPFPAAADRIFKNKKDYETISPYGTPSDLADGTWFCSWLYKDENGNYQWMDRIYNPGKFDYTVAVNDINQPFPSYTSNNPSFRDVPSTVVLDPGVLYKYDHIGETTAATLVTRFGGLSGERLKIDLSGWGTDQVDNASGAQPVRITNVTAPTTFFAAIKDQARVEIPTANFSVGQKAEISVNYAPEYCPEGDFTTTFWAYAANWMAIPKTNIVGNYSSKGGYSVEVDTLSSYPFMVLPELSGGHLLYLNQDGSFFKDKSVRRTRTLPSSPKFVCIDSNNFVTFADDQSNTGSITKLDAFGKLIATTQEFFRTDTQNEVCLQLLTGPNDSVVLLTNKANYYFDQHLNLINSVADVRENKIAAYKYDIQNDTHDLVIKTGDNDLVYIDLKYLETQEWSLREVHDTAAKKVFYRVYRGEEVFVEYKVKTYEVSRDELVFHFSKICFDPLNRLWLGEVGGKISVYDPTATGQIKPIFTQSLDVGSSLYSDPSLSFFCRYDYETKTHAWRAIVCFSEWKEVFILDLNGSYVSSINRNSGFDPALISRLQQSPDGFQFRFSGDFTGYEHRRVFYQLSPYKGKPQIVLKTALKNLKNKTRKYDTFKALAPIDWLPNSFQHFAVIHHGPSFSLYRNGVFLTQLSHNGLHRLSLELQPMFFIGTTGGSTISFNEAINTYISYFDGAIGDVKVYDYALPAEYLEIFLRASVKSQNITWTIPGPENQYIEKVERFFQNKKPGIKSPYYNIRIAGSGITDKQTRMLIEEQIRDIAAKIQPNFTNLLQVQWID